MRNFLFIIIEIIAGVRGDDLVETNWRALKTNLTSCYPEEIEEGTCKV